MWRSQSSSEWKRNLEKKNDRKWHLSRNVYKQILILPEIIFIGLRSSCTLISYSELIVFVLISTIPVKAVQLYDL